MISSNINTLKKRIVQLICSLIILQPGTRISAQASKSIGAAIGTSMSGNGHGTTYIPQLCFGRERNTLMLGVCMQQQAMKFNGARLAYSFILSGRTKQEINMDEDDSTEIYQYFEGGVPDQQNGSVESRVNFKVFFYVAYLKDNLLSKNTQKMEAHVNRVEGTNWKTATLTTIESGIGMQIGIRLAKDLYWNSFVAASFYYHTKYIQNMHHEQFSPSITLGTSITIPKIRF
jgi:hypothetical protein